MHLSHGIEVAPNNDPWVELADEAMETITLAGLPGSWAVDWLPFRASHPVSLLRLLKGLPFSQALARVVSGGRVQTSSKGMAVLLIDYAEFDF